jgi:hypothetical protein
MGCLSKKLIMLLILAVMTLSILPLKVEASDVKCQLIRTSPNGNIVYVGTMPLNFTISWSDSANSNVIWVDMNISYSIDDNPKVIIDRVNVGPPGNSSTYKIVDISNLTDGAHKLALITDGIYDVDNLFIHDYHSYFEPIFFSVNVLATSETPSPTPTITPTATPTPTSEPSILPTPTPSVPEFSWLTTLLILLAISIALIIVRKRLQGDV